jgi:hypothetical protein
MTALRLARLDLEQPVVGADHELCGDRRAVRACPQAGDVALEPGQGAGFGLELAGSRSWRRLASSCADPMCSISRDPRWEEYTICTAVAPGAVFTRRRPARVARANRPIKLRMTDPAAGQRATVCITSSVAATGKAATQGGAYFEAMNR